MARAAHYHANGGLLGRAATARDNPITTTKPLHAQMQSFKKHIRTVVRLCVHEDDKHLFWAAPNAQARLKPLAITSHAAALGFLPNHA